MKNDVCYLRHIAIADTLLLCLPTSLPICNVESGKETIYHQVKYLSINISFGISSIRLVILHLKKDYEIRTTEYQNYNLGHCIIERFWIKGLFKPNL